MPDARVVRSFLFACFADFYEDLAQLKAAAREGRLAAFFAAPGEEPRSLTAHDQATMTRLRLQNRLARQAKRLEAEGTELERKALRAAHYLMAALADEILIFDVRWPGQDVWHEHLLEVAAFGTAMAGRDVFDRLDALLAARSRGPLDEEIAGVALMTLQLGFQGRYRGAEGDVPLSAAPAPAEGADGAAALARYRMRLLQFVGLWAEGRQGERAFPQAYAHRLAEPSGQRLAPLARWYRLGAVAVGAYLALSTVLWLVAVMRLQAALGGG